MGMRSIVAAMALGGMWISYPAPARAQIASYVDEHGKLIYINGDSRTLRRTANANSTVSRPGGSPGQADKVEVVLPERLERIVRAAADRHQLDPALVKAVIGVESAWNPMAMSRKGALGLMQLIPSTANRFGVGNAFDPMQNIEGGTRYLRTLLDRFNGDLEKSLAAYNAGEGAVDRSGGIPNYWETRHYVQKVTSNYFRPGSGRNPKMFSPITPHPPVRRALDEQGRIKFTNE